MATPLKASTIPRMAETGDAVFAKIKGAPEPVVEKPADKPVVEDKPEIIEDKPVVDKPVQTEKPEEKPPEKPSNPNLGASDAPAKTEVDRPKNMGDKDFVKWKDLHSAAKERDTLKAELQTLKAKLEEAGKPNPEHELTKKELEALKAKFSEYEGEISVTRVEATADFKKNVTQPVKEITESITELAKRYEVPPKGLLDAIMEPDAAKRADLIEEATSDFKRADQLDVVQAAREYSRAQKIAGEYRADASKKLEEIERQSKGESERELQENRALYQSEAASAWENRLKNTPTVRRVEGQTAWNSVLDEAGKRIAEIDVNNLDTKEVAEMAAARELVPHLEASVNHLQKETARLTAELKAERERNAAFLKQSPAAGGGHSTVGDVGGGNGKTGKRLAETMPAAFSRG